MLRGGKLFVLLPKYRPFMFLYDIRLILNELESTLFFPRPVTETLKIVLLFVIFFFWKRINGQVGPCTGLGARSEAVSTPCIFLC